MNMFSLWHGWKKKIYEWMIFVKITMKSDKNRQIIPEREMTSSSVTIKTNFQGSLWNQIVLNNSIGAATFTKRFDSVFFFSVSDVIVSESNEKYKYSKKFEVYSTVMNISTLVCLSIFYAYMYNNNETFFFSLSIPFTIFDHYHFEWMSMRFALAKGWTNEHNKSIVLIAVAV